MNADIGRASGQVIPAHEVKRAEAIGSAEEIIQDLIRACEAGMNWMEQASRANLSSATRGILTTDMGACLSAAFRARQYLELGNESNADKKD